MNLKPYPLKGHGVLKPYGILIHTTGDGIPKTYNPGDNMLDHACSVYANMAEGPHFVIVPDGSVAQLRKTDEVAYHAKTTDDERRRFLDGTWETDFNRYAVPDAKQLITFWKLRWPGYKTPQHLYPTRSPNFSYIGIELVPCGTYNKNTWEPSLGTPATPKGRYTAEQYQALALLCYMLNNTLDLAIDWTSGSGKLATHEDVNPYSRPGWDPGVYRGWFSWNLLIGLIRGLEQHEKHAGV